MSLVARVTPLVKGSRRSADHDDLDWLNQGLVDGHEEPLQLVLEERPHDGPANFSNIALKLSRPMFIT